MPLASYAIAKNKNLRTSTSGETEIKIKTRVKEISKEYIVVSLGTSVIDKSSTSTVRKHAPRYKVLLHNDDFNSMEHGCPGFDANYWRYDPASSCEHYDGNS